MLDHKKYNDVWNKGVQWSEEARLKMSESHKKLNHAHLNGGNGTGPSPAESLLRTVLPEAFVMQFILPVPKKIDGIPTHYKIDFADPTRKIAIEVQGQSHSTVLGRQRDMKKRNYLESLGWTVLYITNQEVKRMFGT